MADLHGLVHWVNDYLQIRRFQDYGPNGLQVEGRSTVEKIVTGVTASQWLLKAAIEEKADLVIVHHGLFWKKDPMTIVGWRKERLRLLLQTEISLAAYHLPLDAHPDVGNNVQLAQRMGWIIEEPLNADGIGHSGRLPERLSIHDLITQVKTQLNREPLWVDGGKKVVQRIAWCTGAAQSMIEVAASKGVDVYISGEISENTTHLARELGIHYLAIGHHASESFGVQALGELLKTHFGVEHVFIDIPNPV